MTKDVMILTGAGQIGMAIARRIEKHTEAITCKRNSTVTVSAFHI